MKKLRIRKLDLLRDYIRGHGLEEFEDIINDVEELINRLGVLVLEDKGSLEEFLKTVKTHNLLPGDTLIAIIAKHYGINTIPTFDEDFKRVPWLKVVP